MKNRLLLLMLSMATVAVQAQSTNDFLISAGFDVIKTDIVKPLNKIQVGLDVNYFIERRFSVSAGAELWTERANSFVLGGRWYPNDDFFVRLRGLIGSNDLSMGAGWNKPINKNLRFEAMGDIYIAHPDFALRCGLGYVINYVTGK